MNNIKIRCQAIVSFKNILPLIFFLFVALLVAPSHAEDSKIQSFFNSGDSDVFNDLTSGELLKSIIDHNKTYYLEQDGDLFEEDIATIEPEIQGLRAETYSFSKSKRLLATKIYPEHPIGFYSGCRYKVQNKKLIPIHRSCGFKYRKNKNRSERIEWEHIVPAWMFGHQLRCWQQGGRLNCRNNNATFKQMEADMHNLVPAIGEINGDRSNFKYGMIEGEQRLYGKPDIEIAFSERLAEPPTSVQGDIARTYFYMVDKYKLKLSRQQQQLFIAWNNSDPVDAWERKKNRLLKEIQGDENLYITHYKKLKQGDVIVSDASETFEDIKTEFEPIFAFLFDYLPAPVVNILLFLTVAFVWWSRRKAKQTKKNKARARQSKQANKKVSKTVNKTPTYKQNKARKGVSLTAIKADKSYYLQTQLTNKLLTLDKNNKPIISTQKDKNNQQQWQLIPTNKQEGFVFIQQIGTNQVLEIEGALTKDGAKVRLATRRRRSNDHQEWKIVPLNDNSPWYFLQNRATENVLDVAYKKTKNGTPVVSSHKKIRGYENQLWLFEEV